MMMPDLLHDRPAANAGLPNCERATPTLAVTGVASGPSRRRRVLVVDDARSAAVLLGKLLEALGQDVIVCHDAATALEASRRSRPEIVISDIGMPQVNGYQLASQLRAEPELQHVVLVALTGYDDDSNRQRAKEAGFNYHLVKPVGVAQLQDLLNEELGLTRAK